MKQTEYTMTSKVWKYPGIAGWFFFSIPKKESAQIKKDFQPTRRGWGSIPVRVTVGSSSWNTSIFPSKEGFYMLPVKAAIRKKEKIGEDDRVTLQLQIGGRV